MKTASTALQQAALKLAKQNPEFRRALVAEMSKTSADITRYGLAIHKQIVEVWMRGSDDAYDTSEEDLAKDHAAAKKNAEVWKRGVLREFDDASDKRFSVVLATYLYWTAREQSLALRMV